MESISPKADKIELTMDKNGKMLGYVLHKTGLSNPTNLLEATNNSF